jgi:hypothetical protein
MKARRGAVSQSNLDPVKVANEVYDTYDYASFTVADSTTDYDCETQQSALWKNVPIAVGVIIWSDQDITVKFNDTDMPGISHEAAYSPHEWFDKLQVTNIFITNASGSTANVRIFLV